MAREIPLDVATRVVERLCREANCDLVLPGSPRREAVVYGLAAAHALTGDGWSVDHARQYVTTTLPGPGAALDLLGLVPVVGPVILAVAKPLDRTAIYLAPEALRDGVTLYKTIRHELGHVGDIARGGLPWCAAYGILPEARAGGEAPCYGHGIALDVFFNGTSPYDAANRARASLANYWDASEQGATDLAHDIIGSWEFSLRRGGDPGGVIAEARRDFAAEGLVL